MPRLPADFLVRVESLCDRVLDQAEALSRQRRSVRIVDQIAAAGTAVGANLFEADQAMSRPDFCKCCAIAAKELSETRYWIRLVGRRGWIAPARLELLEAECMELQRIVGTMIACTRQRTKRHSQVA